MDLMLSKCSLNMRVGNLKKKREGGLPDVKKDEGQVPPPLHKGAVWRFNSKKLHGVIWRRGEAVRNFCFKLNLNPLLNHLCMRTLRFPRQVKYPPP